jgi:hypothetical protein
LSTPLYLLIWSSMSSRSFTIILNIFTGAETKVLEFATSCLCLGRGCQRSTLAKRPREA